MKFSSLNKNVLLFSCLFIVGSPMNSWGFVVPHNTSTRSTGGSTTWKVGTTANNGPVLTNKNEKNDNKNHYKGRSTKSINNLNIALFASSNNQFDVSKPVFDILSLRSIRGDALVRYNALNQSEPLRIQLYALLILTSISAPGLSETLGYGELSTITKIGWIASTILNTGLFIRECTRRSNQLTRFEKELNAELLPIRLPTNALAETRYSKSITIKELRGMTIPPRILAISGTKSKLEEALKGLSVLGQRLFQSKVYVVAIPTDGSKVVDCLPKSITDKRKFLPWLADAGDNGEWQRYFEELSSSSSKEGGPTPDTPPSFRWFGLNSGGRSIGSGEGDVVPIWVQLLGQQFRPIELLDDTDDLTLQQEKSLTSSSSSSSKFEDLSLLQSLQTFYHALTTGNEEEMDQIMSSSNSQLVTEVIDAGGRIDSWKECLADGARPEGMKVANADSIIISDTEAYTTLIEFPVAPGFEDATLLAVQYWTRRPQTETDGNDNKNKNDWQLQLHQTIPWSTDNKAQGTLRCDCRGCVALTRGPERKSFAGII